MALEHIENEWFLADFPSEVVVEELPSDGTSKTTEFTAELEPFGRFRVAVTEMPLTAYSALSPIRWIQRFGDALLTSFSDEQTPVVTTDTVSSPSSGAVRQLAFRIDYEGPCAVLARIIAFADGDVGRVMVVSALVDQAEGWEPAARQFIGGVKAKRAMGKNPLEKRP